MSNERLLKQTASSLPLSTVTRLQLLASRLLIKFMLKISLNLKSHIFVKSKSYSPKFSALAFIALNPYSKAYYEILEKTQKGSMDITNWLVWFLENLLLAINSSEDILKDVLKRAEFWQKNINITFNERQKKVLNRFMDDFKGNLTTTKWAKMCNCSQDTATRDISDLINKKILKKLGTGRSTHYGLK